MVPPRLQPPLSWDHSASLLFSQHTHMGGRSTNSQLPALPCPGRMSRRLHLHPEHIWSPGHTLCRVQDIQIPIAHMTSYVKSFGGPICSLMSTSIFCHAPCVHVHIAVDLITNLPPSQGYTVILTIIDRFSKSEWLIPLPEVPTAFQVAELLFEHNN